jgi:hypothetical protein
MVSYTLLTEKVGSIAAIDATALKKHLIQRNAVQPLLRRAKLSRQ